MTIEEFEQTLSEGEPKENLPPLLKALWFERTGDWARAHSIAQDIETKEGAWVHAYLHRREGDLDNASYWYRRSGRDVNRGSMDEEWRTIAAEFLSQHRGNL